MTAGDVSLVGIGRAWERRPPRKHQRKPVDGPPVMGSRQLAIADAMKPEARERIRDEARAAAAEVMAAFEAKR